MKQEGFCCLHGRGSGQPIRPFVIFGFDDEVSFRDSGIAGTKFDDEFGGSTTSIEGSFRGCDRPVIGIRHLTKASPKVRKSHERILQYDRKRAFEEKDRHRDQSACRKRWLSKHTFIDNSKTSARLIRVFNSMVPVMGPGMISPNS